MRGALRGFAFDDAYTSMSRYTTSPEGADLVRLLKLVCSRLTADVLGLAECLRRAQCGLAGHAMVLNVEPERLSLRCLDCGQQTPGWTIQAGNG